MRGARAHRVAPPARRGGRGRAGRRAILHIGTEKTGTTTIQAALAEQRPALAAAGFRYPDLGPQPAHSALALFGLGAADDQFYMRLLSGVPTNVPLAAARALIGERLAADVAEHPDATFLLSTEHASSCLTTIGRIERLKRLLDRHFGDVRILCYLRRWDRLAVSLYSTYLRNGGTAPFSFDALPQPVLDYAVMLDRWAQVFGRDRVEVAIYERAVAAEGGLLGDVATRMGLPFAPVATRRNEALPDRTGRVLRLIGHEMRDRPDPAMIVRAMILEAPTTDTTMTPLIDAAAARAFVATRAEEAERVRARFFPGEAALFDDLYADYDRHDASAHHPCVPDWREAAGVLSEAIVALHERYLATHERYLTKAAEHNSVAAEVAFHRAFMHLSSGRHAKARGEAAMAIALSPLATYYHLLAHIDQAMGDEPAARSAIDQALAIDPDNADYLALRAKLV